MQDSTSLVAQNNAPIQQNNIPATAITNSWQNAEGGIQAQTISNLTVNMLSATSEMVLMLQQLFNGMKPGQTITHAIEWTSLSKTHFNIFVLEKEEFNCGMLTIPKTVSLNRYMHAEDIDFFLSLSPTAQDRLKQMPCIFAKRNMQFKRTDPNHPAVLGRITVTLNTPTYKNISYAPSLINFFYGKNGTGKSTVASCIRDGKAGISWESGCDPSTRLLVYNEDFIEENIQSYGNIPGVFTISEADANARKELDEAIARKKAVDGLVSEGSKAFDEIAKSMDDLEGNYAAKLWKMTEELRKFFPSAMGGFLGSKKRFFQNLLKYNAVEHDLEDLRTLYATVFGKQHPRYQPYSSFDYKTALPFSELISKPIISRSDTEFAKFIRALGNLDWVRRGHDTYAHSAGDKCPYCQQILPPTFETDLASCYDAQYKQELEELKQFVATYKNAANQIYRLVTENLKNPFPTPPHLAEAYKYEFDIFMAKATNNVSLLEKKLAEPSAEIWEFEDLSPYLHKLSDATDSINHEIMAYMDLLKDIPGKQRECTDMVWELLAHTCAGAIAPYGAEKENCLKKRQDLMGKLDKYQKEQLSLQKAITVLNNKTVNTTKVILFHHRMRGRAKNCRRWKDE